MRCKVGDLAVIVNDPYCGQADLGRIVEVVAPDPDDFDEWECRPVGGPPLSYARGGDDPSSDCVSIPDEWLRPIRPSEGTDETLAWKPVPLPKIEIPEAQTSQHVLKAEAARPDATDRELFAMKSPRGGAMGMEQPAAAGLAECRAKRGAA